MSAAKSGIKLRDPACRFAHAGYGLLERAADTGGVIETTVIGTAEDVCPTCASVRPTKRRIVER